MGGHCVAQFYCCCDKIANRNKLQGRFIWLMVSGGGRGNATHTMIIKKYERKGTCRGQGKETCPMVTWKKNVLQGLRCLKTWSPVSGAVWEVYGIFRNGASLGEGLCWGKDLRIYSLILIPVSSASCTLMKAVISPTPASASIAFPPGWILSLWHCKLNKHFLKVALLVMIFAIFP